MKKRYQYIAANGELKWTDWFNPFNGVEKPKIQLKTSKITLLNEYQD